MLQDFISMHINAELYLNQNNGYNFFFFFPMTLFVCLGWIQLTFFANLQVPVYIPMVAALHVFFMEL